MLALLRFVENPRDRVAGFRLLHLLPGIGSATAQRVLDHMAEAADPIAALASIPTPPRAGDDWKGFVETIGQSPIFGMARRSGACSALVRTASRAHP